MLRAAVLLALLSGAASAQVQVRSGLVDERTVAPGGEAAAALEIVNAGPEVVRLRVYLRDLAFDRGRPAYPEAGTSARSNAAWLGLPPTTLDVLPGQTATVPYTVRVPDDAALAGSYWSVAMVEGVPDEPAAAPDDGVRQVRFRTRTRLGVQLITHVAGADGALGFDVAEEALEATADGPVLAFTLANTGERAVGPEVLAEIYGPDGALVEIADGGRPLLYPGSSVRVRLPLASTGPGHTALVIVDPGADEVFGKEVVLDAVAAVE